MSTINETLRKMRESSGMSAPELADAAGVGRPTVWRIENRNKPMDISTLEKLANAMGYDLLITFKERE